MNVSYLLLAIGLLLANGFFVGAEFALIATRRTKMEQLAAEGNTRADLALRSIRELSFMLAAAQLGITMASLGLGAIAEPAVAHLIESGLEAVVEIPAGLLHTISFTIALTIVVYLHMVIGEMAPKNIAIADPERTALWFAIPIRVFANVFRPFIGVLNALANGGLRLLGVEPKDELVTVHSAEQIGTMIAESAKGGMLKEFEQKLLTGAIEFGELDAGAVMVPRTEITALPRSARPSDVERVVLESGHSRIPIYGKDLDNILGFFHAKDLLRIPSDRRDQPIPAQMIRQMLIVPESRKLHPLLLDMRRQRKHFALVVDEHGGTAGVVTIEDLVEELVGEIRDEYDQTELEIERLSDDRFVIPGTLRIDEVRDHLGLELPEGEYETVAGFLMDRLGRIPKRRDTVEHEGWTLRVLAMRRRRVLQVLVERASRE